MYSRLYSGCSYRRAGAVESAEEVLLLIKTRAPLFEELRARIVALHPYEVPEVVAVPLSAGHGPYMEWIGASTGDQ
ncbi:MAG: divalent-cation tolerance protein CutA [Bryobacterales bacterium]|nr:divalent-cation tolerance protein CutA [Bryobacterales bacterium]